MTQSNTTVVKWKREGELITVLVHLEDTDGNHVSDVGYKEFDSEKEMRQFYGDENTLYVEDK